MLTEGEGDLRLSPVNLGSLGSSVPPSSSLSPLGPWVAPCLGCPIRSCGAAWDTALLR